MGCMQSAATKCAVEGEDDHPGVTSHTGSSRREKDGNTRQVKLLLLGAGDSGKTTVVKQMKLMHEGGYNDRERQSHKDSIFSSTIQSMRAVLQALPILKVPLQPGNESRKDFIMSLPDRINGEYLPKEISDALKGLWHDPGVRAVVNRAKEFQLNDSASYFFHALERMSMPGYLPTDQDILRSRVKTTGIIQTTFRVGDLTYNIFDVGGQRSERKKWINCFEGVTALVFLVSLSEYDQRLYEADDVNRMEEALTLFDSICNSRWFVNTTILVFFNKIDLFAEKLPRSPLVDHFPDYKGSNEDYPAACEFLKQKFLSQYRGEDGAQKIHSFLTCATDSRQIQIIMESVKEILLAANLRDAGIL